MMIKSTVKRRACGFTLIELLMGIAVLGILVTLAVPSLSKIIRDNQVASQANELVALVNLTRNEAIRRGIDANTFDSSGNQIEAVLRLNFDSGWTGHVSVTGAVSEEDCPAGVIRCSDDNSDVTLTLTPSSGTSGELSFESRGYTADFSTAAICMKHTNCTGDRQKVMITILASGQIQRQPLACDAACPPPAEGG